MALSRRTGRSRLTLALLVLTSVALLTLDFRDAGPVESARRVAASVFSPLRGAAETATEPIADVWNGITSYGDLEAENERLRAQIEEMEGQAILAEDATKQLRELLSQQELSWIEDVPTTTARVVAGPASNFSHTIDVDKGSDDGIAEGMPVVNGAGLVGRVIQVTGARSTVQLITSPDFKVGVKLLPDGTLGTATGQGRGEDLLVDLPLPADANVPRGRVLTTSGADRSAFPASIPLGRVQSTQESPGGLTLDLIVRPAADTTELGFVTVLLWHGEEP